MTTPRAIADRLVEIARAAAVAPHGRKEAIYAAACQELHLSRATLHRKLATVQIKPPRKQRADTGDTVLTREEMGAILSYFLEHYRKNGKRIKPYDQGIAELRANGVIVAGRVDPKTGEIDYLSDSAILRALRRHGLHPAQALADDPYISLKSPHPNYLWQIDASLCVLYKLPQKTGGRIEEIKSSEFYKNKLAQVAKVEHLLVQRYVISDHASGVVFPWYGLGGESTDCLVSCLIAAVLPRPGFPFHGVPNNLMLDQASANRSGAFRNLCGSLGIALLYTQPGNPRSKGQVEQAQNLVECRFESGLALTRIETVDQLNELALNWMHWFNADRTHTRHGQSRYACWQTITEAQLRRVDVTEKQLRVLARETPVERPVDPGLNVRFKGQVYSVADIPGVMVGEKLLIGRSAYGEGLAQVTTYEEGREVFHVLHPRERDSYGFFEDAAPVGEKYKRHADTPAQTARKQAELLATGATTQEEAKAARKAKVLPFGGAIDPYKEMRNYQPPAWLPKRGAVVDIPQPTLELPPLSHAAAAKRLVATLGADAPPDLYARLQAMYPAGQVPEVELERIAADFRRSGTASGRPALRAV